jgi:hypothetical protein
VAEGLRCTVCGELLAEEVTENEIILPGGERIPFRRHTDFVTCPSCLSMYRASDVHEGKVAPVSDVELPSPAPDTKERPRRRSED